MSIALGASPTQSAFIYFLAADVTRCIILFVHGPVINGKHVFLFEFFNTEVSNTALLSLTISSQGFLSILFEF
jgi:hypothetical protein